MCKQKNSSGCCYNYYMVGNSCVACPPGYSGVNCNTRCKPPLYGHLCVQKCSPSCQKCDFATGCSDLSSNKQLSSNPSMIGTTLEETPAQSTQSTIPQIRDAPKDYTLVIAGTGGVIALFLAIIVMLMCLKMRSSKQLTTKTNSMKPNITDDRDVYHEINDMNVAIDDQRYLDVTEQSRKESALQHLYTAKCNSYQKIDDSPKYLEQSASSKHTNNSTTDSSNGSDGSAASYLKPQRQSKRHSYIQVTDIDTHPAPADESVVNTRTLDRPQNRSSSQYDDVISLHTTTEFSDVDHGDADDTNPDGSYLDVVNCDQ